MKAPSNLDRGRLGFNMAPMIDIVFLLIIFYLVSLHLSGQEVPPVELNLPEARSAHETQHETETPRVTVNVLPGGDVLVAGKRVDRETLAQLVRFERQRHGANLQVRIRCDRDVPYKHVEPILVACAEAGIWNVTFAVVRHSPKG